MENSKKMDEKYISKIKFFFARWTLKLIWSISWHDRDSIHKRDTYALYFGLKRYEYGAYVFIEYGVQATIYGLELWKNWADTIQGRHACPHRMLEICLRSLCIHICHIRGLKSGFHFTDKISRQPRSVLTRNRYIDVRVFALYMGWKCGMHYHPILGWNMGCIPLSDFGMEYEMRSTFDSGMEYGMDSIIRFWDGIWNAFHHPILE